MFSQSTVEVVAVSWGPQAKPLVADIACRGTQAMCNEGPELIPKLWSILQERNRCLLEYVTYIYTGMYSVCIHVYDYIYIVMYSF